MVFGIDPAVAALLIGLSGLTSFFTAAFGLGGGALLLAAMASLVPPAALIPVHGLVQLGSNAGRVAMLRRHIHRAAVPGFAAGSVVGAAAGGAIVVELPGAAVQVGVGLFVLFTVAARAPRWLSAAPVATGVVSSFLTMFFGATGLFVSSYSRAFALGRQGFVATHAALMTLQHGIKVVVFALLGFAFADWAALAAAMIGAGLLGTWIGRAALMRVGETLFRRLLDIILVALALRLIWQGLT